MNLSPGLRCFVQTSALLLLGFVCTHAVAQTTQRRLPPSAITLGPGLLEYRMQCADKCQIECFQNGAKILSQKNITSKQELRLFASRTSTEDLTPRWIEIRPANQGQGKSRTLLLSHDTFCDLSSLLIVPTNIR